MAFPLDGAFATLRREVENVTAAFAAWRQSIEGSVGASARGGASGSGVAGAASGVEKLAASQDKAARSSMRLRDALRDTSGAASGLQRTLASGGTLAKMFGFEEAGRKLENFSKGLGAVKDAVTGIVAAGPALTSMGVLVGAVLAGVGAIQEGVRRGTGETLSLTNAVAGAALAVGQVIHESVAGWKLAFNNLKLFVQESFAALGQAILEPILASLVSIGLAMQRLGIDLQKSTNPAVRAAGDTLREFARGALAASDTVEEAYEGFGRDATQAAQENSVANQSILADVEAMAEGVRVQINKLFDLPEGKSLFSEPLAALKEMGAELDKILAKLSGGAAGGGGGGGRESGWEWSVTALQRMNSAFGADLGPDPAEPGLSDRERANRQRARNEEAMRLLDRAVGDQAADSDTRKENRKRIQYLRQEIEELTRLGMDARQLGQLGNKLERMVVIEEELEARDTAEGIAFRAADAARAGHQAGVEYTSGLLAEIQKASPQINEELFNAIAVDPDNGKIITSFRDLWKNIKNVFRENPLAIFGLFGSSSGLGTTSSGAGGSLGFAQGGKIGRGGVPSLAHMFAGGLAHGGRPAGLDPRDTVPIWAQAGEFMEPVSAVRKYGNRFMESVRSLQFPQEVAHAFSSGFSSAVQPPRPHSMPQGYAGGGAVAGMSGGGAGGGMQVLPVMVTDTAGAEHLIHGGKNAILRLFNEDPDFRGLLSR